MWSRMTSLLSVLFVVAVLAAGSSLVVIETATRAAVERGLSEALGVRAELSGLDYRPLSGRMELSGLSVANLEEFERPLLAHIAHGECRIALRALIEDVVDVDEMRLEEFAFAVEHHGLDSNAERVLDHVSAIAKTERARVRFRIRDLVIENVTAHVITVGDDGSRMSADVRLGRFDFQDLGADPAGMDLAEFSRILLDEVVQRLERRGIGMPASASVGYLASL